MSRLIHSLHTHTHGLGLPSTTNCRFHQAQRTSRFHSLFFLPTSLPLGPPSSNEAAAHAFRGLHGRKSDFSLLASASGATFSAVLDGNAHYYKALASELENFSTYEALVSELEYRPAWMSGGLALHRPAALGSESQLQKSPTYERIVRFLAGFFGVEPIRSLVNHYRSAEDFTAFHSDQYFSGVNMTIGASFGEERSLVFEHRETKEQFSFPQQNGDVFAFTDSVNRQFVHGIPRERQPGVRREGVESFGRGWRLGGGSGSHLGGGLGYVFMKPLPGKIKLCQRMFK
ncbi:unnamed protein product [Durusdinium trenchii]|uniref:Uncharacterized protein R406 n=2 Tax=Durusdinium trenchii TaxID=1381693 RepID=A0ABP0RT38_9DINO